MCKWLADLSFLFLGLFYVKLDALESHFSFLSEVLQNRRNLPNVSCFWLALSIVRTNISCQKEAFSSQHHVHKFTVIGWDRIGWEGPGSPDNT